MSVPRVTLALSGGLVAWALFFGGGDSSGAWLGSFALALAALLVAAAFDHRLERPSIGRLGTACVACFAGLVLWQGASIVWSVQPDRSWDYVNRGLVYLAFLALGTFVGALVPRATRAAAAGLAAVLGLVLAYALLAKGIPALYPDYGRLARLRTPVGYWNGLALVGDFALVLGLWRAAQRRLDGALVVFAATTSVLLAYSRGGVIIGVLAVAVWLALDSRRLESLVGLALGGAAGAAVVGIALALHGVTDDNQPHSVRVHDGWLFLVALVLAGAAVAAAARFLRRHDLPAETRRRATVVLLVSIGLACGFGIVAVTLHSGSDTASPAGTHCVQGVSRFACGSSDERLDWWRESWQAFEDNPLEGTGAASFELAHRLRRSEYTRPVTEPHNFALQVLGETGIVGFLLFAGAVAFGVLAVRRRLRDDAAVALAICALAYLAHILIDAGYDFVAVSAPFFTVVGVLLAPLSKPVADRQPIWALGALLLAATGVLSLAAPYVAQRKVDEAVRTGKPALAAQAHSWNPVSVVPLLTQAVLEERLAHNRKALQLYREAVNTQPDNPDAWVELGLFQLDGTNDPCAAYLSLEKAYELDRYNRVISVKGGPLDVARAKVNTGICG